MTPELARATLEFLNRTTLRPAEIDVLLAVRDALMAIINPPKAP